mmetsp:Transcript_20418/g.45419  ORF Transcript_20418/g.45419 Transcript_20418/m.45419 type:complete len:91 (+) Transcript_20418:158-430(+)
MAWTEVFAERMILVEAASEDSEAAMEASMQPASRQGEAWGQQAAKVAIIDAACGAAARQSALAKWRCRSAGARCIKLVIVAVSSLPAPYP